MTARQRINNDNWFLFIYLGENVVKKTINIFQNVMHNFLEIQIKIGAFCQKHGLNRNFFFFFFFWSK